MRKRKERTPREKQILVIAWFALVILAMAFFYNNSSIREKQEDLQEEMFHETSDQEVTIAAETET